MKTLTYENQHEIGFDIDCLPAWATVIFKSPKGFWVVSQWQDDLRRDIGALYVIFEFLEGSGYMEIPEKYEPKNFDGDWKDSLFKIDRTKPVKYNGTYP